MEDCVIWWFRAATLCAAFALRGNVCCSLSLDLLGGNRTKHETVISGWRLAFPRRHWGRPRHQELFFIPQPMEAEFSFSCGTLWNTLPKETWTFHVVISAVNWEWSCWPDYTVLAGTPFKELCYNSHRLPFLPSDWLHWEMMLIPFNCSNHSDFLYNIK